MKYIPRCKHCKGRVLLKVDQVEYWETYFRDKGDHQEYLPLPTFWKHQGKIYKQYKGRKVDENNFLVEQEMYICDECGTDVEIELVEAA